MTTFVFVVGLVVSVFVVLFLGGLASAALEVRSERRAGLTPTRPAWDARAARRASGGNRAAVRGYWRGLRGVPRER